MNEPLYSVGTWDTEEQAYTPQNGLTRWLNLTQGQLRQAIQELRECHYKADRKRAADGTHDDNDGWVLIERTDGRSEAEILESWKR